MTVGLIFMSAIVPTVGHRALVEFASRFMEVAGGDLHVVITERPGEPFDGSFRACALQPITGETVRFHVHEADANTRENPSGPNDSAFWKYWKTLAQKYVRGPVDFVFASEHYGARIAAELGASFVPFDIDREHTQARGTDVRKRIFERQEDLALTIRDKLASDVIFFGPESCGKTTLSRHFARELRGQLAIEWARPYLETVGPEITEAKMLTIVRGQRALEHLTRERDRLLSVFDTNLLTTLGFYRLYGMSAPQELADAIYYDYVLDGARSLYIVMNDRIPFEQDPLRYGGDKRESTVDFWVYLLEEHKMRYHVVQSINSDDQKDEVLEAIMTQLPIPERSFQSIRDFKRAQ